MQNVERLFLGIVPKRLEDLCYVKGCLEDKAEDSHLCPEHRAQAIIDVTSKVSRSPIPHLKRDMDTPRGLCWVYFVGCRENNIVKIGLSTRLKHRMSNLRNFSPIPIKLFTVFLTYPETERLFHEHFKEARRHGEWFEITDELNEAMKAIGRGERPSFMAEDLIPSDEEIVRRYYGLAA